MDDFTSVYEDISTSLSDVDVIISDQKKYDGIIVLKNTKTNSLQGENSSQTHFAITGERMGIFPYLESDSYFDNWQENKDLKLYYTFLLTAILDKKNCDYLSNNSLVFSDSGKIETHFSVAKSLRTDTTKQAEMGHTSLSDENFTSFRMLLSTDDYLIILKRKKKMSYEFYGLKNSDSDLIASYHKNKFYRVKERTNVSEDDIILDNLSSEPYVHTDLVPTMQTIFYGPPGTGKSYIVSQIIKEVYANYDDINLSHEYVFRTTLHKEFDYSDFIGNIQPVVKSVGSSSEITYDFVNGIFTQALIKSLVNPQKNVYLVLEEMTRGDIAAIFGDIFQLLDRDENGRSIYSIKNDLITKAGIEYCTEHSLDTKTFETSQIYLPPNMHIIGTVNTSDQNVYVMDSAFKRRFEFEYVDITPKTTDTGETLNKYFFTLENEEYEVEWIQFYQHINKFIIEELRMPEDKQVGQFFIKFKQIQSSDSDIEKEKKHTHNYRQIYNKLLQYLWEDIHLVSMSSNSLFKDSIKSYSHAYNELKKKKNIFSNKLMSKFKIEDDEIEVVSPIEDDDK